MPILACRSWRAARRLSLAYRLSPSRHAVVVGRGAARRHEHEVALGIGDESGPRVGAAALVRVRDAIPDTQDRSGPAESGPTSIATGRCAHRMREPPRLRVRPGVVADRRSGDDDAIHCDRWRGDGVGLWFERRDTKAGLRSTMLFAPKSGTAVRPGVESDELRLRCGRKDSSPTRRIHPRRLVEPVDTPRLAKSLYGMLRAICESNTQRS